VFADGFRLRQIGVVQSTLLDPAEAPKQGREGAPDAWILLDPSVLPALDGVQAGDRLVVLTWLHLADREVLRVHPRDNPATPLRGVFATRSSDRPNPVGLHEVEVLEVGEDRLHVAPLEAIDGTPVVDLKLSSVLADGGAQRPRW
jgi:tRNA-Thr(GGU) m(6)t(6)A37 methyltransferase TsaA